MKRLFENWTEGDLNLIIKRHFADYSTVKLNLQ